MSNKILREELGGFCYLGGIITIKNPLTIHEIIPKRNGGKRIYINCALLCRLEHDIHNIIEIQKPIFGNELAYYYHYIRDSRDLLAIKQMRDEVYSMIYDLGYEIVDKGHILSLRKRGKKYEI